MTRNGRMRPFPNEFMTPPSCSSHTSRGSCGSNERSHLMRKAWGRASGGTSAPAEGIVGVVEARWWAMRPAQSLKPASYICPLCDGMLHATSEHALLAPEGDVSRRRHAHLECVVAARRRGELPTEDEFRKATKKRRGRRG